MTKKDFIQLVKASGGTTGYSGSNKNGNKATMFVKGLPEDFMLQKFGRHFKTAFDFKIQMSK